MPPTGVATTTLVKPKNFLGSKTIWGGLLAAAAAIVPVLTGGEITAEDVGQVASGVEQLVQVGGGLVGLALVLWGRFQRKYQPVVVGSSQEPVAVKIGDKTTTTVK